MQGRPSLARRLVVRAIAGSLVAGLVGLFLIFLPVLPWLPLAIGLWQHGSGAPSGYDTGRGNYYRVSVRYLVDKVEPLNFDIVVACGNNRLATPKSHLGTVPTAYARRTADNHAVLIGVPDICLKVKERLLGMRDGIFDGSFAPFTIWFDDAENLETGLGYGSIYAYRNPAARLTFLGAEIRYATREEFADWFAHDNDNLLTSAMLQSTPYDDAGWLREDAMTLAEKCYGIGFFEMNTAGRALLGSYWPADRPEFWSGVLLPEEQRRELEIGIPTSKDVKFSAFGHPEVAYKSHSPKLDWNRYAASDRTFTSLNQSKLSSYLIFDYLPSEQYPVYYNDEISLLTAGKGEPFLAIDIDLRPESRGFVACYSRYFRKLGTAPRKHSDALKHYFGSVPRPDLFKFRVNGVQQFEVKRLSFSGFIFQSDNYIGLLHEFYYSTGKKVE